MQGVKEKLDRDEIKEINFLLESLKKKILDLKEYQKMDKLKLHKQKAELYAQLFNSENDVKYRKEMLKEYEFIFNIASDLKSLDTALQSIAKIIKLYDKLGESSKVEEWKKKEEEVKSCYSGQPGIIINKINKIERDIRMCLV
ncbi:hypothetical protein [Wolbachia endosymbiont (group B) of Horisme vitalbata]|uniref:hypothetical protein n=1 Tax=Wolbachia endosymbiont (group B) of Horisme vitalbata TaxID=3066178 RepID=UPI0033413EB1